MFQRLRLGFAEAFSAAALFALVSFASAAERPNIVVILSDDILTEPADSLKDIKVLTPVLGGKPDYGQLGAGKVTARR